MDLDSATRRLRRLGMAIGFVSAAWLVSSAAAFAQGLDGAVPTDALGQTLAQVTAPVTEATTPVVQQTAATVTQATAPVTRATSPAVGTAVAPVATATAPVAQAAAPVVRDVTAPVATTAAPVNQVVTQTLAPVNQAVNQTLAPVTHAVLPVVDETLAPVSAVVAPVVQTVVAPLSKTLAPVAGAVGPLAGTSDVALGSPAAAVTPQTTSSDTSARPAWESPSAPTATPASLAPAASLATSERSWTNIADSRHVVRSRPRDLPGTAPATPGLVESYALASGQPEARKASPSSRPLSPNPRAPGLPFAPGSAVAPFSGGGAPIFVAALVAALLLAAPGLSRRLRLGLAPRLLPLAVPSLERPG